MSCSGSNDPCVLQETKLISRKRARICMLTARKVARNAYRCGIYEGEDVLSEIDAVDLIYLKPAKAYGLRQEFHKRIVWHDPTRLLISRNVAFLPLKITREYDLFIAYMPLTPDLIHIAAVRGWKDYCRTSICWIDEIWAADVAKLKSFLPALRKFDHIVIGLKGTVNAMSNALKRQCHFVPIAVDAIRFSPYAKALERVIDIYYIGRRREGLHQALLDISAQNKLFYVYDTFNASKAEVNDYKHHREMFASMAKRSRYFIVAPAKVDRPEERNGQIEVGLRYYEAAAAGAIMLGEIPKCETFKTLFNWPDAVIEIQPDGSDVDAVLSKLAGRPERLLEISRRNAAEALLRHDWVYRWKNILNIADLKPGPELEMRENKLKQMAEQILNGG